MKKMEKNKPDSGRYKVASYSTAKSGMFSSRPPGPGLETLAIMPRVHEAHVASQLRAGKIIK